jgi:hypothetical protein
MPSNVESEGRTEAQGEYVAAWEELETDTAVLLGGRRIVRDWAAFESAPDVEVSDFHLVCECKAHHAFRHLTLLETCRRTYCGPADVPALVTRRPGGRAAITVPLDFFAGLLNEIRAARPALSRNHGSTERREQRHAAPAQDPRRAGRGRAPGIRLRREDLAFLGTGNSRIGTPETKGLTGNIIE